MYFDGLTMPEFSAAREQAEGLVIWPVGIIEEHGPHLPLATDSLQVEWTAKMVAARTGALLAPPLRYGLAQSTRNFPGTISIGFDTLRALATDVLREFLRQGLDRVVILSGHAGGSHMTALKLAAHQVVGEWEATQAEAKGREPHLMVLSEWDLIYEAGPPSEVPEGDGHAGAMETSRLLVLHPELVKGTAEASFPPHPNYRVVAHPETFFPSGVMGDPPAASVELGGKLNSIVVERLTALVEGLKEN